MTGDEIYHEIFTLASGTLAALYRELSDDPGPITYAKTDAFARNWAEWAKEEVDCGHQELGSWLDAWNAYCRAGEPGFKYIQTGKPQ